MHRWQERQNVYKSDSLENYDIYTRWMLKESGYNDKAMVLTADPFSFRLLFFCCFFLLESAFTEKIINLSCFPFIPESHSFISKGIG